VNFAKTCNDETNTKANINHHNKSIINKARYKYAFCTQNIQKNRSVNPNPNILEENYQVLIFIQPHKSKPNQNINRAISTTKPQFSKKKRLMKHCQTISNSTESEIKDLRNASNM